MFLPPHYIASNKESQARYTCVNNSLDSNRPPHHHRDHPRTGSHAHRYTPLNVPMSGGHYNYNSRQQHISHSPPKALEYAHLYHGPSRSQYHPPFQHLIYGSAGYYDAVGQMPWHSPEMLQSSCASPTKFEDRLDQPTAQSTMLSYISSLRPATKKHGSHSYGELTVPEDEDVHGKQSGSEKQLLQDNHGVKGNSKFAKRSKIIRKRSKDNSNLTCLRTNSRNKISAGNFKQLNTSGGPYHYLQISSDQGSVVRDRVVRDTEGRQAQQAELPKKAEFKDDIANISSLKDELKDVINSFYQATVTERDRLRENKLSLQHRIERAERAVQKRHDIARRVGIHQEIIPALRQSVTKPSKGFNLFRPRKRTLDQDDWNTEVKSGRPKKPKIKVELNTVEKDLVLHGFEVIPESLEDGKLPGRPVSIWQKLKGDGNSLFIEIPGAYIGSRQLNLEVARGS